MKQGILALIALAALAGCACGAGGRHDEEPSRDFIVVELDRRARERPAGGWARLMVKHMPPSSKDYTCCIWVPSEQSKAIKAGDRVRIWPDYTWHDGRRVLQWGMPARRIAVIEEF